jgi:tellurite resistance protein TerC
VLRFLFIFVTGALIHEFDWILYIFGAFLVFSGAKIMFAKNKEEKIDTDKHPVVRFLSRYFRVTPEHTGNFFARINGKRFITPLFIVLIMVEVSDVIFAVDSIPAIFSVTIDPYIVFFSNIFAILGLRSLFFLVIKVIKIFRFLSYAISFLLVFIGAKIFLHEFIYEWGFTTRHSLLIVFIIIALGIFLSVIIPDKKKKPRQDP